MTVAVHIADGCQPPGWMIGRMQTMERRIGFRMTTMGAACLIGFCAGCETSSHKSVRTYEYNEQPRPAQVTQEPEVQMVSPGEMVSPGTMVVDPDGS
jgi:hypothetical protein